ncbi:hypothetical protein [Krasilnikovia sp. MM14-A1259]|uniref:hypothetical protein n=1 Tax=Krasilnikovia sp. MM14-A1259 TaxID=3373539 RepID=UPI00380E2A25
MSGNAPAEVIGDWPELSLATDLPIGPGRGLPPLRIRRYESDEGPAYWRWDCADCGEYGGGRHHDDAVTRAMRHCEEHPDHRSSLLPPTRCRRAEPDPAVHPMLFAVDDEMPPPPLNT